MGHADEGDQTLADLSDLPAVDDDARGRHPLDHRSHRACLLEPMRFDGRRVLVTGGSRGIGRAVFEAFAAEGAAVAVHSSKRPAAVQAPHVAVIGDISDPAAVQAFVADAVERLGGLDVLVNNAGVYEELDPLAATYDEWQEHWRRTIDVDLLGPAWVTFCALPHLRASGHGK